MRVYKIEFDRQCQKLYFEDKTRFKWIRASGGRKEPRFDVGPNCDNPMLVFDGVPKQRTWAAPRAFTVCDAPGLQIPNIFEAEDGGFALDPVAKKKLSPLIARYGELLPLVCEPALTLFHVTRIVDCLDRSQSDRFGWNRFAFLATKLTDASVFKTAPIEGQTNLLNFALEQSGDPTTEFKAAVEHHGLTGLVFRLVWDSVKGTILPKASMRSKSAKKTKKIAAKGKPPRCRERPLTDDEREEVESYLANGFAMLRLDRRNSPDRVQKAIQAWIDEYRKKKRPVTKKVEDAAIALGCLWAHTVCKTRGWKWVAIRKGRKDLYAVVSPKRECVAFPIQHVMMLLKDRQREPNSLLLYNMIRSGEMTAAKPMAYQVIG